MKKCLLLFVLGTVVILNSCSVYSPLPHELEDLAFSILKNPERLYNLQNYYPNYFNEDYIDNRMRDSAYLSKLINEMKKWEKQNYAAVDFGRIWFDTDPEAVNSTNKHIRGKINSKEDLFSFSIEKDGRGFSFHFIHMQNKYYINRIGTAWTPTL